MGRNVLIPPDQNVLLPSDQNVSILFVNNIYIGKYLNSLAHEDLIKFKIFIDFLGPKCPNTLHIQLIPLDQIVLVIFVNNIHTGNVRTLWRRKLYIKTWCSSKSLWISLIFLVSIFGQKISYYSHIICYIQIYQNFAPNREQVHTGCPNFIEMPKISGTLCCVVLYYLLDTLSQNCLSSLLCN